MERRQNRWQRKKEKLSESKEKYKDVKGKKVPISLSVFLSGLSIENAIPLFFKCACFETMEIPLSPLITPEILIYTNLRSQFSC